MNMRRHDDSRMHRVFLTVLMEAVIQDQPFGAWRQCEIIPRIEGYEVWVAGLLEMRQVPAIASFATAEGGCATAFLYDNGLQVHLLNSLIKILARIDTAGGGSTP